jgi:outer membrane protein assembly factor BamB
MIPAFTPARLRGPLLGLCVLLGLAPATGAQGPIWPMFHGDARHSGLCAYDAPFDSMLAWSYATGDTILFSSPVVSGNGVVYIGNGAGDLVALSPQGSRLWSYEAAGNLRYSTPALAADGTLYVGGGDGRLHAVNPDSTQRWTFPAGAAIKTSPAVGPDGTIYFGADDGKLYALWPSGALRWSYQTGDTVRTSPAVAPDGTILFGSMDRSFYALWPNGTLRWSALTGDVIKYCSPAVTAENVVYFGSYDNLLYAVTTAEQFLWAYDTGHVVRSSPAIGPDGRIYLGTGSDLLCLGSDGSFQWDYGTGGTIYSSPLYLGDDDVICVGSDDGAVYCIREDGSLDWRFTAGPPVRSSPGPSGNGRIYAADLSGVLWALGPLGGLAVEGLPDRGSVPRVFATPSPASGRVRFAARSADLSGAYLRIFDAQGRPVAKLAWESPGALSWDGTDATGRRLPAGSYYFRIDGDSAARSLILVR